MTKKGLIIPKWNRTEESIRRVVESRRRSYRYPTQCVICSEPANRKGYCMMHSARRYRGYKYELDTPKGYGSYIAMINGGAKRARNALTKNITLAQPHTKCVCNTCGRVIYRPKWNMKSETKFCSMECYNKSGRKSCFTASAVSQAHNKPSRPEQRVMIALAIKGIQFIHQWPYELGVADFFIPPNIIVECDGEYWHGLPDVIEKDERKTSYLKSNGLNVLRFSDREINNNINLCVSKITSALSTFSVCQPVPLQP